MSSAAVAESARVALRRQDWERAQTLFGRLIRLEPRNPFALLGSGLAWHNSAWLGDKYGRVRATTRTSLDRIEIERRALAMMDSASACAGNLDDWSRARSRIAQVYEHLGLFIDALEVCEQIETRDPGFAEAHLRRAAIIQALRAPLEDPRRR